MPLIAQEIPKIGLVMEAVKVVRWLKNVGDSVNVGEALLEVETEKSVLEIEAVASGRLTQILVQVNQEATVGDQVAWIDAAVAARGRIVSTPVARKLAAEHGLDMGAIAGTGPGGRVQLSDGADAERAFVRCACSEEGEDGNLQSKSDEREFLHSDLVDDGVTRRHQRGLRSRNCRIKRERCSSTYRRGRGFSTESSLRSRMQPGRPVWK